VLALIIRRLLFSEAEGSPVGAIGIGAGASAGAAAAGAAWLPQVLVQPVSQQLLLSQQLDLRHLKRRSISRSRLQQLVFSQHEGSQAAAQAGSPQAGSQALAAAQAGSPQVASQAESQQLVLQHLLRPSNRHRRAGKSGARFLQHFGAASQQLGSAAQAGSAAAQAGSAAQQAGSAAAHAGSPQVGSQQLFAPQHPPRFRPNMRSSSSKPKLWLHRPALRTSAPKIMFHFIEQRLLCQRELKSPDQLVLDRQGVLERTYASNHSRSSACQNRQKRVASASQFR